MSVAMPEKYVKMSARERHKAVSNLANGLLPSNITWTNMVQITQHHMASLGTYMLTHRVSLPRNCKQGTNWSWYMYTQLVGCIDALQL